MRACAAPWEPMPAELLPRCAAATLDCYDRCSNSACLQACIDADPTPALGGLNCNACLYFQGRACASMRGCRDQLDAYECCLEERCSANPASCPACETQRTAWIACFQAAGCYIDAGLALECYAEPGTP